MLIGVLALQGDFAAHVRAVEAAGFKTRLIRQVGDVEGSDGISNHAIDGLILPGGESTVQIRLLKERGLWEALDKKVKTGIPVFTTCAGTILAAAKTSNPEQEGFGWLPITVKRNAYGDQRHSFEAGANFQDTRLKLVFIRAPQISEFDAEKVKVLIQCNGQPVLVQHKNILAATFHPELTGDPSIYRYLFSPKL
jgi:5'-phosphate synthase pdxT subunit